MSDFGVEVNAVGEAERLCLQLFLFSVSWLGLGIVCSFLFCGLLLSLLGLRCEGGCFSLWGLLAF